MMEEMAAVGAGAGARGMGRQCAHLERGAAATLLSRRAEAAAGCRLRRAAGRRW